MDYLDPQKKRRKKNYLMLMYALLGIAIAISTMTLIYLINGYSIDRNTGEVIQNGLIYIDSKPESADVYLNGVKQRGRTDLRMVVPGGTYDISMYREGYREWKHQLILEGGSLRRLTYGRLVPEKIDSEVAVGLGGIPTMTTQSPDKRWLVMSYTDNPLLFGVIDLSRPVLQLDEILLPLELLENKQAGTWKVIDWSDDNKTFLAEFRSDAGSEFVLINREDPTKSINIKKIFPTLSFDYVTLNERKNDKVNLFDSPAKILYKADVTAKTVETALTGLTQYKSYGSDTYLYLTEEGSTENHIDAHLKVGDKDYKLRTLNKSDKYLLDISKLGGAYVVAVSSASENRAIVYNDPINAIKNNDFSSIPVPTTVLRVENPEQLSISSDSSCVMVYGNNKVASHEFEADRSYTINLANSPDKESEFDWVDGQHLLYVSAGKEYIMDFTGSNQYDLMSTSAKFGAFADKDINYLFSFNLASTDSEQSYLMRNFMRTKADR
ncbi:PEGA domain-containing protein [Candidatus Saccharibacteria bacterium]|nr:PEGA domain-containing protein [Candidatus Saccharibacteria bacterium]